MLVDTSVWVDHLRNPNTLLSARLDADVVRTHPFVIGELACGNIAPRQKILRMLSALRSMSIAEHDEVLKFVDDRKLHGAGLGWVDMHLLASAHAARTPLWTLDKRLSAAARTLDLASGPD
jgi:predicted nucleic acid-binding protein